MTSRRSLLVVRFLAVAVFLVPGAAALWAHSQTPLFPGGFAEFREGLRLPWISMTVIDLFTGFTMITLWIFYRERRIAVAVPLTAALWFFGNMVVGFYVFVLTFAPNASLRTILLGRHEGA